MEKREVLNLKINARIEDLRELDSSPYGEQFDFSTLSYAEGIRSTINEYAETAYSVGECVLFVLGGSRTLYTKDGKLLANNYAQV